jgi:hypothetical protein
MILLQALMALPFAVIIGYLILSFTFFILILIYNYVVKKIGKNKLIISSLWCFLISLIIVIIFLIKFMTDDEVYIN